MEDLELAIREIKEKLPGMTLLEHEPMSAHSSFRIGGPARALAVPSDVMGFTKLCAILREHKTAPFLLGNGSNVLFPDEGLPELLLVSTEKLQKLFLLPDGGIYAEAGVSLARLAAFACEQDLTGLEFASGIPGTVGGGLRMNAGAYGGEMKDVVDSVVYYYLPWQELFEIKNENCRFGYRSSIFQQTAGMAILSAVFRPQPGDKEAVSAKMRELNEKRREKQPLDLPSAGSAFRRPEGHFAAALIDRAGLKGFTVGGAQVSEKHAGFVVNRGGATSKDVYELMMHVREVVHEQFGVVLEPEIIILPPDYRLVDDSPMPKRNRILNPND